MMIGWVKRRMKGRLRLVSSFLSRGCFVDCDRACLLGSLPCDFRDHRLTSSAYSFSFPVSFRSLLAFCSSSLGAHVSCKKKMPET